MDVGCQQFEEGVSSEVALLFHLPHAIPITTLSTDASEKTSFSVLLCGLVTGIGSLRRATSIHHVVYKYGSHYFLLTPSPPPATEREQQVKRQNDGGRKSPSNYQQSTADDDDWRSQASPHLGRWSTNSAWVSRFLNFFVILRHGVLLVCFCTALLIVWHLGSTRSRPMEPRKS
jgi:hypothetical protein